MKRRLIVNTAVAFLLVAFASGGSCAMADDVYMDYDPSNPRHDDAIRVYDSRDRDDAKKAEDARKEADDYTDNSARRSDAGEFAPKDFIDEQFGRRVFIDLVIGDHKSDKKDDARSDLMEFEARKTIDDELADNRKRAADHRDAVRDDVLREKLGHIQMIPDWVPSPLDPVNNGGFGTGGENGRPVPYRLNGHVDIERGDPWQIGQ